MSNKPFILRLVALVAIIFVVMCGVLPVFAIQISDDEFIIIPEATEGDPEGKSKELGKVKTDKTFREEYNEYTVDLDGVENAVGAQIKSGIISWNFILWLLQQIVRFIANTALIVGSMMIIYAGYLYVTAVYGWSDGNTSKAQRAIKYAIIGLVIVIFSYAFLKIVVNAFL